MSYTYVIERSAAEFVLSRNSREQRALLAVFEELSRRPSLAADFSEPNEHGREVLTRFVGPFSVTYWVDHAVSEVRIAVVRQD